MASVPPVLDMVDLIDRFNEKIGKLISYLIIGLTFAITYEVIARYGFNAPTEWGYETSIFLFGAYAILGGGYTLRNKSHVKVDLLYSRLSPKGQAILDLLTSWLFFIFCGLLVWKGGEFAWTSLKYFEHTDTAWSPPIYYFKMTLPLGALFILLQGASKFVRDFLLVIQSSKNSETNEH